MVPERIEVVEQSIDSSDAKALIAQLSKELCAITGNGGEHSFDFADMKNPRAVFMIAYVRGKASGCGALRERTEDTAEMKRVFAKVKGMGIGRRILKQLEERARALGYAKILVETRKVNKRAVKFYLDNGYKICNNYGKYAGHKEAICFQKLI